jgi:hypothetical protein
MVVSVGMGARRGVCILLSMVMMMVVGVMRPLGHDVGPAIGRGSPGWVCPICRCFLLVIAWRRYEQTWFDGAWSKSRT